MGDINIDGLSQCNTWTELKVKWRFHLCVFAYRCYDMVSILIGSVSYHPSQSCHQIDLLNYFSSDLFGTVDTTFFQQYPNNLRFDLNSSYFLTWISNGKFFSNPKPKHMRVGQIGFLFRSKQQAFDYVMLTHQCQLWYKQSIPFPFCAIFASAAFSLAARNGTLKHRKIIKEINSARQGTGLL